MPTILQMITSTIDKNGLLFPSIMMSPMMLSYSSTTSEVSVNASLAEYAVRSVNSEPKSCACFLALSVNNLCLPGLMRFDWFSFSFPSYLSFVMHFQFIIHVCLD
jgi:hypothetical protein